MLIERTSEDGYDLVRGDIDAVSCRFSKDPDGPVLFVRMTDPVFYSSGEWKSFGTPGGVDVRHHDRIYTEGDEMDEVLREYGTEIPE